MTMLSTITGVELCWSATRSDFISSTLDTTGEGWWEGVGRQWNRCLPQWPTASSDIHHSPIADELFHKILISNFHKFHYITTNNYPQNRTHPQWRDPFSRYLAFLFQHVMRVRMIYSLYLAGFQLSSGHCNRALSCSESVLGICALALTVGNVTARL